MKYSVGNLIIFFISLIFLLLTSCKKDDVSLRQADEKLLIENYLLTHNKQITPTASGLYFESIADGTGDSSPMLDDFVVINFTETSIDGKLLDTSNKALADSNNIISSSLVDGPLKLSIKGIRIKGLIEGLLQMKEGGHAWMLMPSSLTFNDYVPRIFDVELLKIVPDPVAYEKEKIKNYLDTLSRRIAANAPVTPADSTPEGIYYIETKAGTGNSPMEGDNVNATFTFKLIDGQLIGKSVNYSFRIGDINVIQGLSIGVKKMKKGGKAILVIPFSKGFGTEGVTQQDVIKIPMYATLVYEIELNSIGGL